MSDIWQSEEISLLISLVKSNDCIYNPNSGLYSNRQVVLKIWDDIATHFIDKPGRECYRKWNVLRSGYRRVRKEASNRKKKWIFYEQLSFLDAFTKPLPGSSEAETKPNVSALFTPTSSTQLDTLDSNSQNFLKEEGEDDSDQHVKSNEEMDFDDSWYNEGALADQEIGRAADDGLSKSAAKKKSSMALFLESVLMDTASIPEEKHVQFKMDVLQILHKYQSG